MTEEKDYTKMPFKQRVLNAQNELKAPKNQYNSFGKYHYRSAEDILEAAKKVNGKYFLLLVIEDTVEQYNEHLFLKTTAKLKDVLSDEQLEVSALAKIPLAKKGMDDSQITGAASSYARKYCLNGLYCIDDTKDADSEEVQAQAKGKQLPKQPPIHDAAKALIDSCQALAELINAKDGSQQTAKSVYAYFCNQVVGKEIPTSQLNMKQIKDIQTKAAAMFAEYQAK
ncbi:ERF family protein [Enterococcus cecorum]|nr:ERF family protein [Enterococcus cecorum]